MQSLLQAKWRRGKPFVRTHVGDLAWWSREGDFENIGLWREGGELVAWAWFTPPAELDFHLHPGRDDPQLVQDVLDWFERRSAAGALRTVWALEAEGDLVAALEEAGYERAEDSWFVHLVRSLERPLSAPTLPSGFSLGHVARGDVARRVDVQRAAFDRSTTTEEKYARLIETWPYRADLDVVVEAPDRRFAAFCLAWLDDANAVGELEPVGTHPEFRRRGLARAACLRALATLRELGADTAVVYALGGVEGDRALSLYRSVGFEPKSRHLRFIRQ
jgi:ribosomal protein S18 acetylase RimI-like enzyme